MIYLSCFCLPGEDKETEYKLDGMRPELDFSCYSGSGYPFGLFINKYLDRLDFPSSVVILCGENGSGKSTLLNVIAEKLKLKRTTPYNKAPCFSDFVSLCRAECETDIPDGSSVITSDGVFDFLLDMRAVNEGIDSSRKTIFETYSTDKKYLGDNGYKMKSLDDYNELKRYNEIRRTSLPEYTRRRMKGRDITLHSNGESALDIFESSIKEDALYLLDEPENSLSPSHQRELAQFISDSARFYNCQFIIASHSPFVLAIKGAMIYDLDKTPVRVCKWSELDCVKEYYGLFKERENEF